MSARRRAAVGLLLGAAALIAASPAAAENFIQSARLLATGGGAGDQFGFSAAATPDGSTIVAGAPAARGRRGAVYVFVRRRDVATLTIPGGSAGDLFGISVAISGDGATIVAGAQGAGAAYVFRRPSRGWSATAPIAKLTAAGSDYLGTAVAISADGAAVVAGADQTTVAATFQQGAAYVFEERAAGWSRVAELAASNGGQSDYLGYSVAISADGSTILAGAPFAAVGSLGGQGAAYTFARPPGGWASGTQPQHEAAELTVPDGVPGDALGVSVVSSADGTTLAAGAVGATVLGHPSEGALYVFRNAVAAKLTAASGGTDHDLGGAVATLADGSLIGGGAPGAPASGRRGQGLIQLFRRPGAGWRTTARSVELTDLGGGPGGHLGAALALAGDGAIVVAGAPGEVVGRHRGQGAVYVFTRARRASSETSVKCGASSCTVTVIDTRNGFATGVVRLAGSHSSCRLRRTRSAGVATCKLQLAPGGRGAAVYGGDRLDLPSRTGA